MPNRIIKESICTSDNLTSVDWGAQIFFMRLTVKCDDFGRFDGRPAILRATCYPLELDRVSEQQISDWLDALEQAELIKRYTADGKRLLYLPTWRKHQQTRARVSKYPDPPASASICKQPLADVLVNENVNVNENGNAAAAQQSSFQSSALTSYQNIIGAISGATQAQEIMATLDDLAARHIEGWWDGSLKIAADQNKRSWAYVRGILQNCIREGKPPGVRVNGNGHAPPSDPAAEAISRHAIESGLLTRTP